ncbi:unnamed protein product [Closterium sp. NIES-54]
MHKRMHAHGQQAECKPYGCTNTTVSNEFEAVLKKEGIQHQLTVPNNPNQNGVAKRFNRTLEEGARTLLGHAGLHDPFWVTALRQVALVKNMVLAIVGDKHRSKNLAATISMEAAGVTDSAATTRATDAAAADSTASATIVTRADICGTIASSSLMDGLVLKAKRVEEQEEGEEEAVETVVVAEVVLQI